MWQNKCFCPQSRLKQLALKRKTRAGKTLFPFYSVSGSDTWKKYTETEGSWWSFVSAVKKKKKREVQEEGLGAWRQERECRRENNQEGDLLYLFTPFLSLNRNAVLIKEVDHFWELWHVGWLLFLLATKHDGNYEPYMSNVSGGEKCLKAETFHATDIWKKKKKKEATETF